MILNISVLNKSASEIITGNAPARLRDGSPWKPKPAAIRRYLQRASLQGEEGSIQPALRACKDLTDLLILTDSEIQKYREGDESSSLRKVDHRDIRLLIHGIESVKSLTACLCHITMSEHVTETYRSNFGDEKKRKRKEFAKIVADLSSVSGVAERCESLLELSFETACSKLMNDLEAYREEKTYSRY
jgi:hypothetical protein